MKFQLQLCCLVQSFISATCTVSLWALSQASSEPSMYGFEQPGISRLCQSVPGQKTALSIPHLQGKLQPPSLHWPVWHQQDFPEAEQGRISPRGYPTVVPEGLTLGLLGMHCSLLAGHQCQERCSRPHLARPHRTGTGLCTAGNLCWRLLPWALKNKQKKGNRKVWNFSIT